MYLMILFLCIDLKKILVSETFFKSDNYFFSIGTPTTNKLDDSIPVTHFFDFRYRYLKRFIQTTNRFHDSISLTHIPGFQVPVLEL